MVKIIYIARNIPVPGVKENDIIIRLAKELSAYYDIRFLFPKEIVPFWFFLKGKAKAIARLPPVFNVRDFTVCVVPYIRLPTLLLSYCLIDTFRLFIPKISSFCTSASLIHAHYLLPDGYLAMLLSRHLNIPYIVTIRAGDLKKIRQLGEKGFVYSKYVQVLKNAKLTLATNNGPASFLSNLAIKYMLVPHGISSSLISSPLAVSTEVIEVLVVSSLIKRKNIDWCIRAVGEYKGPYKVRLRIVGDGPERRRLEGLAAGYSNNIVFYGYLEHEQTRSLYASSHIFALPSNHESFGLVYLEAMGNGCAVIAMRGTGIDGYFKDGEEVYYSKPDYDDFKTKLYTLINNPSLRERFRQNGHRRVLQDFTLDRIINRYHEIYESILSLSN